MKYHLPSIFFSALLCLSNVLEAGEKVLIDTDFTKVTKDGVPKTEAPITKKSGFPMQVSSGQFESVQVELPSSVKVSKEPVNGVEPPVAIMDLKKREDGTCPGAGFSWDFRGVPLAAGKYEATWTLLAVGSFDSFNINVSLAHQNEDGTLINVENLAHATQTPIMLIISKNTLIVPGERFDLDPSKPHQFKVDFDLHKNTWGVSVDGKKVLKKVSFPDVYLAEFPTFVATGLHFGGGADSDVQGATYGLARVKLVKLDDDGSDN